MGTDLLTNWNISGKGAQRAGNRNLKFDKSLHLTAKVILKKKKNMRSICDGNTI